MLALILLAVGGTLGGGFLTFAIGLPDSPCAGTIGTTRNFAIAAGLNGYNDSKVRQAPWPVMNAHRCDTVVISVVNNDVQSHGFAIDYYATRGMEIQGGQSQTVRFLASRTGQFRVFCNIFCTVHIYMQNGLLNVT